MHFHIQDHQQKPEQLQGTRNKTKTNQQKKKRQIHLLAL